MSTHERPSDELVDTIISVVCQEQFNAQHFKMLSDACKKCESVHEFSARILRARIEADRKEIERLKNANSFKALRAENAELKNRLANKHDVAQDFLKRAEDAEKENAELKATNAKLTERLAAFEGAVEIEIPVGGWIEIANYEAIQRHVREQDRDCCTHNTVREPARVFVVPPKQQPNGVEGENKS